ncbi:MAG TPA: hypothetical protein VFM25_03915 [Verrucomicrobiae bacterium]|nr:hypothetical protein [Verrucomicrobiae bacterium]
MPNRYVREGIIESEAVNSLSWQAEVFYRRLLNRVDDFGRYTAHPALLRASLFPLQLEKVRQTDIPRLLLECEQAGLLFVYAANEKQLLVLNKWEKGRANVSQYDAPPTDIAGRLDRKDYLGTGIHMGSKVGGVGVVGTAVPNRGSPVPRMGTAALDSDSDPDTDSNSGSASSRVADAERPGVEEVLIEAQRIGLSEWKARDWFNEMEGCGWLDYNHRPIVSWRAVLTRVKVKWEADGRPSQPPSRAAPNTQGNSASISEKNVDALLRSIDRKYK